MYPGGRQSLPGDSSYNTERWKSDYGIELWDGHTTREQARLAEYESRLKEDLDATQERLEAQQKRPASTEHEKDVVKRRRADRSSGEEGSAPEASSARELKPGELIALAVKPEDGLSPSEQGGE